MIFTLPEDQILLNDNVEVLMLKQFVLIVFLFSLITADLTGCNMHHTITIPETTALPEQPLNPILYTPNPPIYVANRVVNAEAAYQLSEDVLKQQNITNICEKVYKKGEQTWVGKEYWLNNHGYIVIDGIVVRQLFYGETGSKNSEDYINFNMINTRPTDRVEKHVEENAVEYINVNEKIQKVRFENSGDPDPEKERIIITYDMTYFED